MSEWGKADWFVIGLLTGYIWFPAWAILKKIWVEAKKAKQEW
jgi:hypothetical protein